MFLLIGAGALGHEVRPAFLHLSEVEPGHFDVVWKLPLLAGRRLPLEPVMPEDCAPIRPPTVEQAMGAVLERWTVHCPLRAGQLEVSGLSATLTDVMVQVHYLDGHQITSLLRPGNTVLGLDSTQQLPTAYVELGIGHLLLGIDHILFLVALLILIRQPWSLVKTVTAFTVAHSITLALSVIGMITLPQGPVEVVIALSIVFMARELLLPEASRSPLMRSRPWIMAFAFGLLHGLGFAGGLVDIGLPSQQLALSLLMFNLGIEAGQLLVVAVTLTGAWALQRLRVMPPPQLEHGLVVVLGCAATFWAIDRTVMLL